MWRIFFLFAGLASNYLLAQTEEVIVTVNAEEITVEELLYAFNKNRNPTGAIQEDILIAFVDQYINFKLKVQQAKAMGLDTSAVFRQEVESFQAQIPKPYLSGHTLSDKALREMYEKMQWHINASHILIKLSPAAAAKDTLKAFQFLDSLRQKISGPKIFAQMAQKHSQDGSAQNGGALGWFTGLQMVQPFEEAAYQTPVQSVSQVVRTRFGYHLVYVHQKRKNRGALKTSHLFFDSRKGGADFAKAKAFAIYDSLEAGAQWDELARKYSEDEGSKRNGGALQWASLNELPADYLDIAYGIKAIGSYSEPQPTEYGWHIVKLDDIRPPEPFEVMKESLRKEMERAGRDMLADEALMHQLKEENGYSWQRENTKELVRNLEGQNISSDEAESLKDMVLFQHGHQSVKAEAFLAFLPPWKARFSEDELWKYYKDFEEEFILAYENQIAAQKYPEYGYLTQEIEEGLLLFEVMQKMVWDRAASDSLALRNFYKENADQYLVNELANCLMVQGVNENNRERLLNENMEISDSTMLRKWFLQAWGNEMGNRLKIAKKTIKASELSNFGREERYRKWFEVENSQQLCYVLSTQSDVLPEIEQIKGQVMADFQDKIELDWIKELKANAKVVIDEKVLKELIIR